MGPGPDIPEENALLEHVEIQVSTWVEWLRLLVEAFGTLVIGAGVLVVLAGLAWHALARRGAGEDKPRRSLSGVAARRA